MKVDYSQKLGKSVLGALIVLGAALPTPAHTWPWSHDHYGKMDPAYYQELAKDWWPQIVERKLLFLDMLDGYRLGKFIFKSFNITEDLKPGNLVVIPAKKINPDLRPYILDTVVYPDRRDAFYLLSK